MKKLLIWLLTVAMLSGLMSSALAYDEEITFRGIPWGSGIEETKKCLEKEFGTNLVYSDPTIESYVTEGSFAVKKLYLIGSAYEGGPLIRVAVTIPDLKVAGFDVKRFEKITRIFTGYTERQTEVEDTAYYSDENVILYFIPEFSDDWEYSLDKGKLVRAVYAGFDPDSWHGEEKVKNEIKEKLNDLYGADKWESGNSEIRIRVENGKHDIIGFCLSYENRKFADTLEQYRLYQEQQREAREKKEKEEREKKEEQEKKERGTDGL